jgi:hypothetical protein
MDGYIHRSHHWMASYIKASGPKVQGSIPAMPGSARSYSNHL